MSIEKAIDRCFAKNYDKVYIAVDLHDTIIPANYKNGVFEAPYPSAVKALNFLSSCSDVVLILYTSSYKKNLEGLWDVFEGLGIKFQYFNANPECEDTETGDFSSKFFFSLIFDDKGGFDPETDWDIVLNKFKGRTA
jgi:hypothetical protein